MYMSACKFLASRCPVACTSGDPRTPWSPSPKCASISLGVLVSVCQLACVSVCQLGRCVPVHSQQVTPVVFESLTVSLCLTEYLALAKVNPCPSADLTERREAAGKAKRQWKEKVGR